jgi:hypothetical protein
LGKAALAASLNSLDILLIAFGILVAVGAVGGSVAGFLHWRRSGEIQVIQAGENLILQGQVAFAQKSASDAEANAAAANERASRIEDAAAWRVILPELSAALATNFLTGSGGAVTKPHRPTTPTPSSTVTALSTPSAWWKRSPPSCATPQTIPATPRYLTARRFHSVLRGLSALHPTPATKSRSCSGSRPLARITPPAPAGARA